MTCVTRDPRQLGLDFLNRALLDAQGSGKVLDFLGGFLARLKPRLDPIEGWT